MQSVNRSNEEPRIGQMDDSDVWRVKDIDSKRCVGRGIIIYWITYFVRQVSLYDKDASGDDEQYKARLVTCRNEQIFGVDFTLTFAAVMHKVILLCHDDGICRLVKYIRQGRQWIAFKVYMKAPFMLSWDFKCDSDDDTDLLRHGVKDSRLSLKKSQRQFPVERPSYAIVALDELPTLTADKFNRERSAPNLVWLDMHPCDGLGERGRIP